MRRVLAIACIFALAVLPVAAQESTRSVVPPSSRALAERATGDEVYRAACLTCHGPDGKGSPRSTVGFDTPLPDFTDCAFATAEADVDWQAVIHEGGPIRGLDRHMPAFGDALSASQIDAAIGHVRRFCQDAAWPRGDLNFPRALFTEKAFPENEVVYTSTLTRGTDRRVGNEIVYERRLGARNQLEAIVPIDAVRLNGNWEAGVGDAALAFRRTLIASHRSGTIVAAGGEITFATGDANRHLGNGYHVAEPFGMFGQALPRNGFLQMHAGVEIPLKASEAKEAYLRSAIGFTHMTNRGFGRSWSPQLEVLVTRPMDGSAEWDVVPQLQVSLSKIQHVLLAAGMRIPTNQRDERSPAFIAYLLWDWFDGPFTSFWK